jgi:IS5 family transposase
VGAVEPFYPKPEGADRRPVGIERMLRIYCLQHWFSLSDPAAEEALYDSRAMRQFAGIDLGNQFFHLLNQYLKENGMKVSRGTVVDATIINAPSSIKNEDKSRDPDMHQTRKGNQWYFGMKAHIGVDSKTKLIHHVVATAANVHDSQLLGDLLHGKETRGWGDSAYAGQKDVIAEQAPAAKDFTQARGSRHSALSKEERARNRQKSKVRARVEHVFAVMKLRFGFAKVRYKGLDKNAHHLFVSYALVNIVM